jgi:hypothetical protein
MSFTQDAFGSIMELARTGGCGWILGDEGGGFHVGRETMWLIRCDLACSSLGMTPTQRKGKGACAVQDHRGGEHGRGAPRHTYPRLPSHIPRAPTRLLPNPTYPRTNRSRPSRLGPLVSDAFKDGDEFVLRLLRNCAGARADQITILCLTLGEDVVPKPRDIRPEEAILRSGGSLVGVEAYKELVLEAIRERGCVFLCVEFVEDTASVGAADLAASGLGDRY